MDENNQEPKIAEHIKVASAPKDKNDYEPHPIIEIASESELDAVKVGEQAIITFNAVHLAESARGGESMRLYKIRSATVCVDHGTGEPQIIFALTRKA